jgi:hypothetical protein
VAAGAASLGLVDEFGVRDLVLVVDRRTNLRRPAVARVHDARRACGFSTRVIRRITSSVMLRPRRTEHNGAGGVELMMKYEPALLTIVGKCGPTD